MFSVLQNSAFSSNRGPTNPQPLPEIRDVTDIPRFEFSAGPSRNANQTPSRGVQRDETQSIRPPPQQQTRPVVPPLSLGPQQQFFGIPPSFGAFQQPQQGFLPPPTAAGGFATDPRQQQFFLGGAPVAGVGSVAAPGNAGLFSGNTIEDGRGFQVPGFGFQQGLRGQQQVQQATPAGFQFQGPPPGFGPQQQQPFGNPAFNAFGPGPSGVSLQGVSSTYKSCVRGLDLLNVKLSL